MYTVKLPDGGEVRHDITIPFSISVHPSVKSFSLSGFPTSIDFPPGVKSYTHSNDFISITYYNPEYYKKDEPKESASSSEKPPKPKADNRLHLAVDEGNLEAIRSLLQSGLNPNGRDDDDKTPLYHASSNGRLDIALFLLEHGADPTVGCGSIPPYIVADTRAMELMLKEAQKQPGNALRATDDSGNTLLHRAAWECKLDDVRFLLEKGIDPNSQNKNGLTPLALTLLGVGDKQACGKLLIEKGAKLDVADSRGNTLLHHAVGLGLRWCVDLLLEKEGKSINAVNRKGDSPLDLCCDPEIKAKLKAAGAKHHRNIVVRALRKLDNLQ